MSGIEERTIRVQLMRHQGTGVLLATSEDMKGLFVGGRSEDEIEQRLAPVIRDLLEAEGYDVVSVAAEREHGHLPASFVGPGFVASAKLRAAPSR